MIASTTTTVHRSMKKFAAAALAATSAAMVMSVVFAPAASAQECEGPDGLNGQVVVGEGGNRSCVGVYPNGDYFNLPLTPEASVCNPDCNDGRPVLVVIRRTH